MLLNTPTSTISQHVERQFPAIYREEARALVSLVEEYYKFVETQTDQSVYVTRRMPEYIDIDRAAQSMLIFYQNKFLSGLPTNEKNVRDVVKNILDLYRRKGTEEGIRLFFKMFYEQDIEIFYPSENMIKPSSSRWKVGAFLQLYPNQNPLAFNGIVGQKIFGSLSKAEAYVDDVQFVHIYGSTIPIIYLDRAKGRFIGLETIFTTEPERQNWGKVYGSLGTISSVVGVTANNIVGDIVDVTASKGYGAKAVVTRVSTTVSGEVTFVITDGDFGYSAFNANTNPLSNCDVILSNQNFIFPNANLEFVIEERVAQDQGANTWHYATIIGQSAVGLGVLLDNVAEPFVSGPFETLDRAVNEEYEINVVSLAVLDNLSANASVVATDNNQTIEILSDTISNFLTVSLDSLNYSVDGDVPMSGGGADITTPLNEAFVPEELIIGRITQLGNIFPGVGYNNNAYVLVKESNVVPFRHKDQILTYDFATSAVSIFAGDILQQVRPIVRYDGTPEDIIAQGKVVAISGEYLYIKLRSFWPFSVDFGGDIFRENSTVPLAITAVHNWDEPRVAGLNAVVTADADFALGRIEAMSIINSGIGYEDQSSLVIHNPKLDARDLADAVAANTEPTRSGTEIDALGIAQARAQGISEGKWTTKTSHLGYADGKRIQDSDYYQDFSYEVATSLNESEYLEELKDTAHPAGIKLFTKFSLIERINTTIEILSELDEEEIV